MKIQRFLVGAWLLFFALSHLIGRSMPQSDRGKPLFTSDAPWELVIQNRLWGGNHAEFGYPLVSVIVDREIRRTAWVENIPPKPNNYKINFGALLVNLAFFLFPLWFVRKMRKWKERRLARMKKL